MSSEKLVVRNRRATFDYHIEERFEAGLVLTGSEVKSLRDGKASLAEAFVQDDGGELYLVQCHIAQYPFANLLNHDPLRRRKLLLHAEEIRRIVRRITEKGYTAIAISIYFKNGKAKAEIGLARGKKQADKREDIKKRDADREARRELRERNR
ncbi:MAG: SsrA-binding protein SmpB [Deltaproteobacteria bacterium]|nr:SsrA-binding protein SmpB [Deltaproteobacteria bacterium]